MTPSCLAPVGSMIPGRSTTKIAAVRLPVNALVFPPGVYPSGCPEPTRRRAFAQIGYPVHRRYGSKFPMLICSPTRAVCENPGLPPYIPRDNLTKSSWTIDQEVQDSTDPVG